MEHNQYIAFKADDKLKQQLQEYAIKTHRSMSGTIRLALDTLWTSEARKGPTNEKEEELDGDTKGPNNDLD